MPASFAVIAATYTLGPTRRAARTGNVVLTLIRGHSTMLHLPQRRTRARRGSGARQHHHSEDDREGREDQKGSKV